MAEVIERPTIPPSPDRGAPVLSDRGAVAVALAAAAGASIAHPVPVWSWAVALVLLVATRRPVVLVVVVGVLASWLAGRSLAGLEPPVPRSFHGTVTLVTDPERTPYATKADVRVRGKRYEMAAGEGAGAVLDQRLAGERVTVTGRIRPPPPDAPWLISRHVVGRLDADDVEPLDGGAAPWRVANRVRRLLERGVEGLPADRAALFRGLVIGDDRDQSDAVEDDFRAAGLTHLLVVSGQNVAFVLAVAAPGIRRLHLGGRWVATVGVIGAFALLTRFEPSVLRASAMAALSVTATLLGRQASPIRVLSLAVAGLLLVDPLLVHSVGFQLSVGASAGIVLLAAPVARQLPGPPWLAEALAVTIAAQVGVAPVQIPRFGGVPVVSLLANPLAVPVAGMVAGWGLAAGLIAGLTGPPVATVVHLPSHVMVWWIAGVARVAARVPLGEIGGREAMLLAAGTALVALGRRWGPRRTLGAVGLAIVVIALCLPAVALRAPPRLRTTLAPGVTVWRAGGATVVTVDRAASVSRVLEAGRRAGLRRLDILLVDLDGQAADDLLAGLRHRWSIGSVCRGGTGARLQVGGLVVDPRAPPGSAGRVRALTPADALAGDR